jgi:Fungal N-terminal domain of STAND proteins
MSVGFGFSTGDFIAALQLVSTIIDALRDTGDSSTEYRALISQLLTLETALLKVKRLDVDEEQHAEVIALSQAACQCQNTIDTFWEKIKKYQPSLQARGSGSRVRDGWFKIKWALCKKDDLAKFKADLIGHTESIELLLVTLHMGSTRIAGKKQEESNRTLAGRVQDSYFGCMQRLSQVLDCVSTGAQQGKHILEMTAKVIQTNVRIFRIVLDIQSVITQIPGQVERQQPVYFIDALGRHTPFNLEFIMSAEALTSVLRSNFKNIGSGADKIDRGEFAIQDSIKRRDIDLTATWESCFQPGQRVDMSMIFTSAKSLSHSCPACQEDHGDGFTEDQDIEWFGSPL